MARALSFLIRYFSNYYTLHRSDLAARAAPLDPRLLSIEGNIVDYFKIKKNKTIKSNQIKDFPNESIKIF